MTILQRAQEKLTEVGYKPEQIEELKKLMVYDLIDKMISDCADAPNVTDAQLDTLESESAALPVNDEAALSAFLEKVADTAYGPDKQNKLESIVAEALMEIHDNTLAVRQKVEKYNAGDPATVAEVDALKNDPQVQAVLDDAKNAGVDFEKEVQDAAQGN